MCGEGVGYSQVRGEPRAREHLAPKEHRREERESDGAPCLLEHVAQARGVRQ